MKHPLRLRTKINLAIACTCLVIAAVFSTALLFYESHRRANAIQQAHVTLQDLLRQHNENLSNEVFAGLQRAALASLSELTERSGVRAATAFDLDGQPFASTLPSLPSPLEPALMERADMAQDFVTRSGREGLILTVTAVLKAHGLKVGFCRIDYSLAYLQSETRTIIGIFTAMLLSTLLLMSWLLSAILSRFVIRPLLLLENGMSKIVSGERQTDPLHIHTRQMTRIFGVLRSDLEHSIRNTDEIGALSLAFKRMVCHLQKAYTELLSAEEKYRGIFENAAEGIFQITRSGRIVTANPAILRMFGFASEEEVAQSGPLVGTDYFARPEDWDILLHELRKQKKVSDFLVQLKKPDGALLWAMINARPVRSPMGGAPLIEGMVLDVTERMEREKAQRERQTAEAATQAKSAFLASMSHEIRTPMNIIIGLSHLALKTALTEQQRDYIGKIQTAARNLLGIINDILDFSKIEAGHMEFENIPFDLNTVLEDLLSLHTARSDDKGLQFHLVCPPSVPRRLSGDPLRLRQVLTNLVGNALKFTEKGHVAVRVSCLEDHEGQVLLHFSVQDTGIGIREGQMQGLFTAFTQADAATTRRFGGSGLGLSICKRLVEMMGGDIGVRSTPGEGSDFFFTARFEKAAKPDGIPAAPKNSAICPPQFLQGRVLLAEDNAVNQQIAREVLAGFGLQVSVAGNGCEAVRMARDGQFDLVLMDIEMPEMNGYMASREIRAWEKQGDQEENASAPPLPIIAMTAHAMGGDREKCLDAGMDDHIAKPIDFDELFTKLARWLPSGPPDISPAAQNRESASSPAYPALPRHLPGFDLSAGLARVMGDAGIYTEVLMDFHRLHQDSLERIREKETQGLRDQAASLLHTLKGVAGNLSARDLSTAAGELENLLRQPEASEADCARAMEDFENAFLVVMRSLGRLAACRETEPQPSAATDGSARPARN